MPNTAAFLPVLKSMHGGGGGEKSIVNLLTPFCLQASKVHKGLNPELVLVEFVNYGIQSLTWPKQSLLMKSSAFK